MAVQPSTAKCSCISCATHLEFPLELAGSSIACPNCGAQTVLTPPSETAPATPSEPSPPQPEDELSVAALLCAFTGKIRKRGSAFFYQIGLLLVTLAIVVLPLLYLAMVAAAGWGVYWWARAGTFLLQGRLGGIYVITAKFLLYFAPLFAGVVVVFFMIKPLLAGRVQGAQPLALNPENEPLLFAFVAEICKLVGAPFPARIDVDCELNASAGFRRGFKSMLGNDLVLTIGMPLVAGMTITQLGGILAHEFGHFTQGLAMRLNYIIRRVNGWFARVIYQRDRWDVTLEEWAQDAEDWRLQLVVAVARLGVWFSRLLLKLLMALGALISSFVSRQMEYDADRYEIDFAGSRCFEETTVRLATFGAAMNAAYKHMRVTWNSNNVLPESIPAFISQHEARMPAEARTAIADRAGLEQAGLFSTHPASGDRIRCARRANQPGVFALGLPATRLFANFDALARQVSLLHYVDDLEIPQPLIKLRSAEKFFETAGATKESEAAAEGEKEKLRKLGPAKLRLSAG